MKNILLFFAMAMFLAACSSNSPKGIADKFLSLIVKGDFEKAKQYATPDSGRAIDMLKETTTGINLPSTYKILEVQKISDTEASVQYEVVQKGETKTENLPMVKIDGKWKVRLAVKKR